MKKFFTLTFLALAAALPLRAAPPKPAPIYINNSPVAYSNTPPQIDATAFLNRSVFDVQSSLPFQAQHVRYWTNLGLMSGFPGFDFENVSDGTRKKGGKIVRSSKNIVTPSSIFLNDGNVSVSSSLNISATNVFSQGRLDGLETANIHVKAQNLVDIARGGVRVGASVAAPLCNFFQVETNFIPDLNITELYWGAGRNNALGTNGRPLNLTTFGGANFDLPNPQSPSHQVLMPGSRFTNTVVVPSFAFFVTNGSFFSSSCGGAYAAFVHTNADSLTSSIVNVVFVATNSNLAPTNMSVNVSFVSDFNSVDGNLSYAPVVEFQANDYDVVERRFVTNYVTLVDASAGQTNIVIARPFSGYTSPGRRPSTYTWIRGRLCSIDFLGQPPNSEFTSGMFYNPFLFSTNVVNTLYAASKVQVGQSNSQAFASSSSIITTVNGISTVFARRASNPALSDPTNFNGSIYIDAKKLNAASTRIRAEDFLSIRTDNLLSNALPQVDAPFIDFDVRSTNSTLIISNVSPPTVNRLAGTISAWSGVWRVGVTNTASVSTNSTNAVVHTVTFHVLIVDNCLRSEQPVTLNRFKVHAPNLVIEDNIFVNSGIVLDAGALTVDTNASLTLPGLSNLAFTNVLDLLNFTNYGTINVPGGAYFGVFEAGHVVPASKKKRRLQKPKPLDNFVNHGTIVGSSILIAGTNVENSGEILRPANLTANGGVIVARGGNIVMTNATLLADASIEVHASNLHIASTFLNAGTISNSLGQFIRGSITLDPTNSFGDVGTTSTNDWFVTGGLRVTRRPNVMGDLMGTRIVAVAAPLVSVPFVWPGEDRGASAAGYSGNLAVGRLVLDGRGGNLFHFSSATANNAIYVDYLELLNDATNWNFSIGIDPDFTIYFADANIPPDKLDRISGGRLRWVSSFAGPQSSTNLVYPNGNTYTFNAGLVRTLEIDSDGDGIVNGIDCTPIPVPDLDTARVNCPPTPLAIAVRKSSTGFAGTAGFASAQASAATTGATAADLALAISVSTSAGEVLLQWNAPAGTANTVEYSDEIGGTWRTLTNFVSGPVDTRLTVRDAVSVPLRVYRVRVDAAKP